MRAGMFAVARVGAHVIGIDGAQVALALPAEGLRAAVPRRAGTVPGAVIGVVAHDGAMVPVLGLDRWIDMGSGHGVAAGEARILLLVAEGRRVGVRVDAVMGVRLVDAGALRRIHHDDDAEELFQAMVAGQGDAPALAVLEVGRLMRLARIWCDEAGLDTARAGDTLDADAQAATARLEIYATFRCADATIALRAADVAELLPTPALQQALPTRHGTRGVFHWRGRPVPVVDLRVALAARGDGGTAPWVCLVRHGQWTLGVLVDEVSELVRIDAATLERPEGSPAIVQGAWVCETGRTVQRVDTAALMALFPESRISAPQPGAADRGAAVDRLEAAAYMVFQAGVPIASPVEAVAEVVPLPDALRPRLDEGLHATLDWRGHVVPVIDLRRTQAADMPPPRQLVVIEQEGQRAAVAIGGVLGLLPARTVTRTRLRTGTANPVDMITVSSAGQRVSYAVLDLARYLAPTPLAA